MVANCGLGQKNPLLQLSLEMCCNHFIIEQKLNESLSRSRTRSWLVICIGVKTHFNSYSVFPGCRCDPTIEIGAFNTITTMRLHVQHGSVQCKAVSDLSGRTSKPHGLLCCLRQLLAMDSFGPAACGRALYSLFH